MGFVTDEESEKAISRLDLDELWSTCGREGRPCAEFKSDLRDALRFYRPGPDRKAALGWKERSSAYNKLEKSISRLRTELENLHYHIEHEIIAYNIENEPEGFEPCYSGEYEGLSYGEFRLCRLIEELESFASITGDAKRHFRRGRGRPPQNGTLTSTIKDLGDIFEKYSGNSPMETYSYDESNISHPYQGQFFDFLYAVFWPLNDRAYPSGNALGDAARRAFDLKK